jgi:ABC-type nitrate/sulfonate/bicarbonate transport system substrate-binding protein
MMETIRFAGRVLCVCCALFMAPATFAAAPVLVRVANGSPPDICTIPDARTFETFLPLEMRGATSSVHYFPGAVRAIQALLADEADVAIATLASGLAAIEQGQDIVVFSLAFGARPYLFMTVRNELKDWKSLEGEAVAVIAPIDSTHYLAIMEMRSAGADPTKVQWRSVGGGASRASALVAGGAKASMLQAGQALDLIGKGPFHILPSAGGQKSRFIFKAFWAKRRFLLDNPGLIDAIVRSQLRAAREASDKARFMPLAVKALAPMRPETISRAYDLLRDQGVWDAEGTLFTAQAGDFTVAEMVRSKILKSPIAFDRWATVDFQRRALSSIGPPH